MRNLTTPPKVQDREVMSTHRTVTFPCLTMRDWQSRLQSAQVLYDDRGELNRCTAHPKHSSPPWTCHGQLLCQNLRADQINCLIIPIPFQWLPHTLFTEPSMQSLSDRLHITAINQLVGQATRQTHAHASKVAPSIFKVWVLNLTHTGALSTVARLQLP